MENDLADPPPSRSPERSPVIAQAFLAGGATLVAAFLLHRLWLAALPRSVCPACGEGTTPLSHPLSAGMDRWLRRRWCAACGWKGWGRNGPVLWPERGPVSHDSGFRWGPERLLPDFGFQWAGRPVPTAEEAAAHPSGFRWAGAADETATGCAHDAAHPSGFRFRSPAAEPAAPAAHPSGFRWADGEAEDDDAEAGGFRWGESKPTTRVLRGSTSFRWKD